MIKSRLNLRNVAIACLAVTMFASCKKDPTPDPIFLLEEMQNSGGTRYEYEYDDQDRIKKITEYISEQLRSVSTLKYNAASGDLEEYEWEFPQNPEWNYKTTFTKNGNKITFVDEGQVEIELNTQGLPEKYMYGNSPSTLTWLNGNLIKIEDAHATRTFTHDDKKSPFYYSKTPKWVLFQYIGHQNVNNLKTMTWSSGSTTTYEYTYNADGFPETRTVSGTSETYKYKKK